jgi:hypothetical protein
MKPYHDIGRVQFSGEHMLVTIDGKEKKFRIAEISSALENASETEKNTYEVSPSGYGIHWPLIDEDLSVDALLGIVHSWQTKRKSA